jgi:hypothetical protein
LENINEDELSAFLRRYCADHWIQKDRIVVMHLPEYCRLWQKEAEYFDRTIQNWNYDVGTDKKTTRVRARDIVTAALEKVHYYRDAILVERMRSHWNTDIPVILVAAGPSLRKNVDLLKRAKGHMLIVAVDHALSLLHDHGVVPDIIACLDPDKPYIKVGEEFRDVPFMCDTGANKESFDWNTGVKILVLDCPELQRLRPTDARVSYTYTGSVAIMSMAVFAMLKAKHIILIGQDLAFSEDGYTHSNGEKESSLADADITLPGYYGGKVKSRRDWLKFWDWYDRYLPDYTDTQVINATEGGASIPHTLQMSLQEAIDQYGGGSLDLSILEDRQYRMTEEEYARMREGVRQYIEEVEELYTWRESDYKKKKEKFRKMGIYVMLRDLIYAMDAKTEWEAFQKALSIMKENGWNRDKEID